MGSPTKIYTSEERELAQLLVTELLAHQFCFPVQWIDTQDTILGALSTERIVEVGPAETLVNMARKTMKSGYELHDTATGLKRELLSYKKNADAIYYKVDASEALPPQTATEATKVAPTLSVTPAPVELAPQPVVTPRPSILPSPAVLTPPSEELSLPDRPLTATDILTAIVAVALKKPASEIVRDQTIKKLCGGRSTVQNEIIGDLTKEFGALPDQPEDMALTEFGASLSESGHSSKLGPCTNALASKFATTKMPAGTTLATLRQYLQSRWSFMQGLQDRCLLQAISSQPASRLTAENQMQSFLDEIAGAVMKDQGIDLASLSKPRSRSGSTGGGVVSSAAVESLQNELRDQDKRLLEVYAKRCGYDLADVKGATEMRHIIDELQAKVDAWAGEHSEEYERGIQPKFEASKARTYDSFWNWVIQDLAATFANLMNGEFMSTDIARFTTKMTPRLVDAVSYLQKMLEAFPESNRTIRTRQWLRDLQKACELAKGHPQPFRFSVPSMVPILNMDEKGKVSVEETPRDLVEESSPPASRHIDFSVHIDDASQISDSSSNSISTFPAARSDIFSALEGATTARSMFAPSTATSISPESPENGLVAEENMPGVRFDLTDIESALTASPRMPSLKTKSSAGFERDSILTRSYMQWFQSAATSGVSFTGSHVLVTGAGKNSIGAEALKQLLSAGAKVVVTTSSYSPDTISFYEELYRVHGAAASQLVVVPFNAASLQDTNSLVDYIYANLGWDLDHVLPFAAIGEGGRDVSDIDARSELAHRAMLTNVLRLLGCIKDAKVVRGIDTHPTQVVLPLSPNHGGFGNDGLYAESKVGLETLLRKWGSEGWADYVSVCGAVIGWTRGTGLMHGNDIAATGIEKELNVRTFGQAEMAWHIVGLMDARVSEMCEIGPVLADLSGGLRAEMDLRKALDEINESINKRSELQRNLAREAALEKHDQDGDEVETVEKVSCRAQVRVDGQSLPNWEEIKSLHQLLEGMVDLDRVVVATGFAEAGPCGSARTRWEAETNGTFSITGCVELAWIMGLIKYHNGPFQGKDYCGWIDAEANKSITDAEIKTKYESYIIDHTGIRVMERHSHDLTDTNQTQMLHEVFVTEDLDPFEVSLETAEDFRREHGDRVTVMPTPDGENATIILRKGVTLLIPKAMPFHHAISAQMPTGWDARRYGIPDDIISQVDPVTLYALVGTVEAFLSAGITDPYELYEHVHVSDVGNAVGASLGGLKSLHEMFKQRFLDRQVQKDILAETFVNTTSAWINMLLLGASGPIRTPVGACATSLESVDTGYDLIVNGKAKAVLVGGTDFLEHDIAAEFSSMQATIDADKDAARGRTPKQGSRPTTSSRSGFVEGEGCGVQLLTTARLALDMGLPIHAIISLTHTAADGIGRSVPAPGKGVLTAASETSPLNGSGSRNPPIAMLDLAYRRRHLHRRQRQIEAKHAMDLRWITAGMPSASRRGSITSNQDLMSPITPVSPSVTSPEIIHTHTNVLRGQIDAEAARAHKDALNAFGNDFYRDSAGAIAPLRGALAVWGLTIDDLDVASLHGTSTVMNDINETSVLEGQLERLGRTKGNILPCVAQKSLLGHGKGAAGAFALNGCIQMLTSGTIPGNRNADNIDSVLASRELLFFPSKTYQSAGGLKAFSVTSFGFGQKGAQVVGVNAKYLFATITEEEYAVYKKKVMARRRNAERRLQEGIYGGALVSLKEKGIFKDGEVEQGLLNRTSRQ